MSANAAVAAIKYALRTEEGLAFLQCWLHGNFDAIRREWTDCPRECFAGADPSVTPAAEAPTPTDRVLPHTHPEVENFIPVRKGANGTELAASAPQLAIARAIMLYGEARKADNADESNYWFDQVLRRVSQHGTQLVQAKQAEHDAIMLEHCPDEMSESQCKTWAAHQAVAEEASGQSVGGDAQAPAEAAAGELVDATSREFPGFFLIAAITRAKAIGDQIQGNPVNVRLVVNGVDLPYTATMADVWGRARAQLDEEAREMAERMVTEAGLEGVADALREVEWKVKDALAKVTHPEGSKVATGGAQVPTASEETAL